MTGQTDELSNSRNKITYYRWAGTKSQVAGKQMGQHV